LGNRGPRGRDAEKIALQKGMNYGVEKNYSVFLMSLRENAPYADALDHQAKYGCCTFSRTCTLECEKKELPTLLKLFALVASEFAHKEAESQ